MGPRYIIVFSLARSALQTLRTQNQRNGNSKSILELLKLELLNGITLTLAEYKVCQQELSQSLKVFDADARDYETFIQQSRIKSTLNFGLQSMGFKIIHESFIASAHAVLLSY